MEDLEQRKFEINTQVDFHGGKWELVKELEVGIGERIGKYLGKEQ